ncbi:MAG: glycosyltransferase family 2 protein [Chitinophagia bacterium]|nr:glycosyltransferase family 2 protein [Chitinophagia bacterium]
MLATFIQFLWCFIQFAIGYNLFFPLLLYILFKLSRKRQFTPSAETQEPDYAIIVTAYEQVDLIPAVVESILALNYANYMVYIVADKCDVSSLHFTDNRVVVLRPPETLGSNTRSHFYAIRNFKRAHERLTIIDSDNLVEPTYLTELNKAFAAGYVAVQGVRKAKNLNTTIACLDAARDMYYHYFDGEALFKVGSSATLAGSGMAFTVELYRTCLEKLDVTGAGFDKVLQYEIVKRKYRIAFVETAVVYDEKTSGSDQLVKQRARWINTWFRYVKFGATLFLNGIINFNWNQFLFGIVLLRPPLFIFLILSMFFMAANIFINPLMVLVWISGFIAFILGFFIAILHSKPDPKVYKSLLSIPKFIFFQVLSLLKIRKANKISVATRHSGTTND